VKEGKPAETWAWRRAVQGRNGGKEGGKEGGREGGRRYVLKGPKVPEWIPKSRWLVRPDRTAFGIEPMPNCRVAPSEIKFSAISFPMAVSTGERGEAACSGRSTSSLSWIGKGGGKEKRKRGGREIWMRLDCHENKSPKTCYVKGQGYSLLEHPVELGNVDQTIPQRPRHLGVNMAHHVLCALHPCPHDIHARAQRAKAVLVRRRHLNQRHVDGQTPSTEKIGDLAEVDGDWREVNGGDKGGCDAVIVKRRALDDRDVVGQAVSLSPWEKEETWDLAGPVEG